jgi:hypothetical protein
MSNTGRRLLASLLTVAFFAVPRSAVARLVEAWPYEKLTKNSDLIVVAVPVGTKEVNERKDFDRGNGAYLQGVVTTFVVKGTLKGECGKTIEVLHYELKFEPKKVGVIDDAPTTIKFEASPPEKAGAGQEYCLFLKARKDKRFEFTSGVDDPQLSVREMRPFPVK